MTTTTADYLAVTQNLTWFQAMTAAEPGVKSATAYYEANIGKVTSIQDLVDNYRLLSYALNAYGLGDQSTPKRSSPRCSKAGSPIQKALPTH